MSPIKRQKIADGVFFNSVKDSRFKTMRITANLIVPLSSETASENALLLGVLSRSCKAYPDFTALSKKLSSLYGADLSVNVSKIGDRQLLALSAGGIDDRYTLGEDSVAEELSKLLCGVIFEPNVENNEFKSEDVEQERRQLLDLIDSEFNDKRTYANSQLIKKMCTGEVYGIERYGTADSINAVTAKSLYCAWKRLLKTANFEIVYIGDSAPDRAVEVFDATFAGIERTPVTVSNNVVRIAGEPKTFTDEMELSQSKLVMGFRSGIASPDEDMNAARLMCAVLGGTAQSKLFCNVREKQSLCYYCASRYDRHKGIVVVDSGVESKNIEKAQAGILKEIDDMKKGEITDFEIESTKLALINAFRSSNDTVGGIDAWYTGQIFDGTFKSIEEACEEIRRVTKDEVIAAAQKLTLDTVYILKNKEEVKA